MMIWAVSFFIGVVTSSVLADVPPVMMIGGLFFAACSLLGLNLIYKHPCLIISAACLFGFSWVMLDATYQLKQALPTALEGKSLTLTGSIGDIRDCHPRYCRFVFYSEKPFKGKQLLSWYNQHPKLTVGSHWQLRVRLKRPHGVSNPGGFAYEKWAFAEAIQAKGYVVAHADNTSLAATHSTHRVNQWRQHLAEKIDQQLKKAEFSGMIKALVIAHRGDLSVKQWQILRDSGTSHLLAISGLHVGMVASACFFLSGWLWRCWARGCLYVPAPIVSAIAAILSALVYAALAGFSIPTVRALVMVSILMLGILVRRLIQPWQSFAMALFIILLLQPTAVLSVGFWLSFGAVFIIFYTMQGRIGESSQLRSLLRMHIVMLVAMLPLSLWFFQQHSLVSLFANAVAIPWVSMVVVPLSLLGSLLFLVNDALAGLVLQMAETALAGVWPFLTWLVGLPASVYVNAVASPLQLLSVSVALLLLLAPKGWPGRSLGFIFLLPLWCWQLPTPAHGDLWYTQLDVGQGTATIIRTAQHVLIYDTGPSQGVHSDSGSRVLIPFLRSQGIKAVDTLIISHGDNDHSGGAASLLTAYKAQDVLTSEPKRFSQHHASLCLAGQKWHWDGVDFDILHPDKHYLGRGNNSSCVLRIRVGDIRLLLVGDIERPAEVYLLKKADDLKADVLLAPHHGSKSSSTLAFVKAVSPRYVLYSTGYRNRYHFPNKSIQKRYDDHGAIALDTAKSGAISMKITAGKPLIYPEEHRVALRRYWMSH